MKVKVRTQAIGITLVFLLLLVVATSFRPLSLLPGAEGIKVGAYSVQNPVSLLHYVIGRDSDPLASIMPTDPYNVRYDPDASDRGYPDFYASLSGVSSDQEVVDKQINYWVQDLSSGNWTHIVGSIHQAQFTVAFKAEPSSNAAIPPLMGSGGTTEYEVHWKSGEIWFATGVTAWNLAIPDPAYQGKSGHVWGAPLSAYITDKQIASDSSPYVYMNPELEVGRQITLFSSPGGGGSIVDIIGNTDPATTNYNSTLVLTWGANQSPDTRMKQIGYFMFQPTDFGVNWWYPFPYTSFSYTTPKAQVTVNIYYLIIGQFIYTNEEYQKWILGQAKKQLNWFDYAVQNWNNFWAGAAAWIANPFNIAGLGLYGLLIVAVIAGVVLIYFFGAPRLKRRKGR